ncbi:MAG: AAA family ATPase [Nevskia sp.]|nr:AAA family ATPase [Nevskia sp.]
MCAEIAATIQEPALIRALRQPSAYGHLVAAVQVVETHISWVLLTGTYAYKIKKPVKLPFLDFSTLDLRLAACREELRLNRRFAPQLYLDLVPITGGAEQPRLGGDGPAIEYAVRMRQFPRRDELDRLLAAGELHGAELEAFGRRLAALHAAAPAAGAADDYGTPQRVHAPVQETLAGLLATPPEGCAAALRRLRLWCQAQQQALAPVLDERRRGGHIRECHGDLHLGNLVRLDGAVTAFDCIEFSAPLRWIDTLSDLAFLLMDLRYCGRTDLAYRVLNAYLEESGDYAGLRVLRYYLVYRALVRAKVASLRAAAAAPAEAASQRAAAVAHIELASTWAQDAQPLLVLMHGLSGSGKSRLSGQLAPLLPAIRIRSDVERKRLHGLAANAPSGSGLDAGLYAAGASARTYTHLADAAAAMLAAGENVIVDAAFLNRVQRDAFRALAKRLQLPCVVLDCRAPASELRRRVTARALTAGPSEADRAVLEHQFAHAEPLDDAELAATVVVDTDRAQDDTALVAALRERARAGRSPA